MLRANDHGDSPDADADGTPASHQQGPWDRLPEGPAAWDEAGKRAGAGGFIEAMNEWAELGERLHKLGDLAELTELIRKRVASAEDLERSNDSLSVPLRIVRQNTSDPPAGLLRPLIDVPVSHG